jgi:hypothetical protein
MPRFIFTPAAVTSTGLVQRIQCWDRLVGGNRLIDLWTVDGSDNILSGITNGILLTDTSGQPPTFAGPPDISTLYHHVHGVQTRTPLSAVRSTNMPSSAPAPKGTCIYSGGAYPARPAGFASVEFIGPVDPAGAAMVNDTWVNTT